MSKPACPHCGFVFKVLYANADALPPLAPIICESCAAVSLIVEGVTRKATREEMVAIQESPAWRDVLGPVRELILGSFAPPADRSKTMLTSGAPVPADRSHTKDRGDGQQRDYVVLSDEERARGFVRPLRDTYTHKKCGSDTTMGIKIAETYARDPKFYNGTFCVACGSHFPLEQFVWRGTDEQVGS